MLRKFIEHVQELRPHVIVTYNGDFFDWPYIDARCKKHPSIGSLYHSLGIKSSASPSAGAAAGARMEAEYTGRCCVHLDAFCWVKRDSYLPQVTNRIFGCDRCRARSRSLRLRLCRGTKASRP